MTKYPSGGNYPETHDDWAEHFIRLTREASSEQMNKFSVDQHKRGGKFAALADLLAGIIDIDEFERLANLHGWIAGDSGL